MRVVLGGIEGFCGCTDFCSTDTYSKVREGMCSLGMTAMNIPVPQKS